MNRPTSREKNVNSRCTALKMLFQPQEIASLLGDSFTSFVISKVISRSFFSVVQVFVVS